MGTNADIKLQAITPEEYHKKADDFFAAEDVGGFIEFQRTHSIIYNDPVPKEDKALLETMELPKLPENITLEEAK